jgi:hypothetical protein
MVARRTPYMAANSARVIMLNYPEAIDFKLRTTFSSLCFLGRKNHFFCCLSQEPAVFSCAMSEFFLLLASMQGRFACISDFKAHLSTCHAGRRSEYCPPFVS